MSWSGNLVEYKITPFSISYPLDCFKFLKSINWKKNEMVGVIL